MAAASGTEIPNALPETLSEKRVATNIERTRKRNQLRLEVADTSDRSIIGESTAETGGKERGERKRREREAKRRPRTHLVDVASSFFKPAIAGPNDWFTPPAWLLATIADIASTEPRVPKKSPITFENTEEAAEANEKILKFYDYNVDALISDNLESTLGYGSEFRPLSQLEPLLGGHPNFKGLSQVLSNGMSYNFGRELDDLTKRTELRKLLSRGNHKSAQDFPGKVTDLLTKDVTHGFAIPIPTRTIELIPNAAVQPLGLARQWTTDEKGRRIEKFRMTQDLSFSSSREGPPVSINSRIDMSTYSEMVFGWCLPRILHFVVALRNMFPLVGILIAKYNYSDAYRRIAHSASAAAQTIAVHGRRGFLSLRLTFGGAPNPPTWTNFSEIVTDLSNEISLCEDWDPEQLHSPAQPILPKTKRLPPHVPFAPGRPLAVHIPLNGNRSGRVDDFIDDLVNTYLDTPENAKFQPHVVPLAMHVTSRPHAGDDREPITRRPLLSLPKLLAEGNPAEVQTVLGWTIDTRRLRIALPDDKFIAWRDDMHRIGTQRGGEFHEIDTLVGRLNHTSFVIPMSRHFMGRLRGVLEPRLHKNKKVTLGAEVLEDFKLWKEILLRAHAGIPINLIVTREPDRVCWSDACPAGMGGYSLSGRAWRLRLPAGHPLRGHSGINNLLEFTAMVVNVWLECIDAAPGSLPCILALGDSTSAIGWLFKSSKLEAIHGAGHDAHLFVARQLATVLIDHEACLASQHIKGEMNVVADLLSFSGTSERGKPHPLAEDEPPNDVLTQRFLFELTEQVPAAFNISQLPSELLSFVTRALQIAALSLGVAKSPETRTTTGSGVGGRVSAPSTDKPTIPYLLSYPTTNPNFLSKRSYTVTGQLPGRTRAGLTETVRNQWYQALSAKPLATWQRRFGAISNKAPCTSRGEPSCAHSLPPSSKLSPTKTLPQTNSEP